ncbi:hypothetical protein V8E53_012608 [Lactarius tabidus]
MMRLCDQCLTKSCKSALFVISKNNCFQTSETCPTRYSWLFFRAVRPLLFVPLRTETDWQTLILAVPRQGRAERDKGIVDKNATDYHQEQEQESQVLQSTQSTETETASSLPFVFTAILFPFYPGLLRLRQCFVPQQLSGSCKFPASSSLPVSTPALSPPASPRPSSPPICLSCTRSNQRSMDYLHLLTYIDIRLKRSQIASSQANCLMLLLRHPLT